MEEKTLSSIELTFENVEGATICAKDVGMLFIDNVRNTMTKYYSKKLRKVSTIDNLVLQIRDTKTKEWQSPYSVEKMMLNERLFEGDIVSIKINYEDGASEEFSVTYDGDETNSIQITRLCYGDSWIAIGKDALDMCCKLMPGDKEEREYMWQLYDRED